MARTTTVAAGLPLALLGGVGGLALANSYTGQSPAAHPAHGITQSLGGARLISAGAGPAPTTPGAVAGFGAAGSFGGPGAALAKPLVGLAAAPDGNGYWAVAADGGVFPFGDATFHGSLGNIALNKPIVGIAATRTGKGYWLVAADGGVFPFGDATFHGSLGNVRLNQPVIGIDASRTGDGYWMAASDGGVFPFGDATFHGGLAPEPAQTEVVGVAANPAASGYWLATAPAPPPPPPPPPVQAAAVAGPNGASLGSFVVTCYDLGGSTATGAPVSSATVAVDPSVIPLGSHIYVDGAGARIAQDTGGAIVGHRLDIWEPSYGACAAWGVQSRQVWMEG